MKYCIRSTGPRYSSLHNSNQSINEVHYQVHWTLVFQSTQHKAINQSINQVLYQVHWAQVVQSQQHLSINQWSTLLGPLDPGIPVYTTPINQSTKYCIRFTGPWYSSLHSTNQSINEVLYQVHWTLVFQSTQHKSINQWSTVSGPLDPDSPVYTTQINQSMKYCIRSTGPW